MATMGSAQRGGGKGGIFLGLIVGLVLGALLLAPRTRAPLVAQLSASEESKKTLQASVDKLTEEKDTVQKELDGIKGSQDSVKKEVDSLKQQLKECQDKSGGNMKQKLADAKAKLDEASKHLSEINT